MLQFSGKAAVIAGAITLMLAATSGALANSERVLYSFTGGDDGGNPDVSLIIDARGNLYGTTGELGIAGNVFRLSRRGRETVLHSFAGGNDGSDPRAPLIMDLNGNLYGTTSEGGSSNAGVVFKLQPRGRETLLYSFTGGSDSGNPNSGLVRDERGNLYGEAYLQERADPGVVFKVSPRGKETVLHTFVDGPTDGAIPEGGLIMDTNGNLYGTTFHGGGHGSGTVFKLSPTGNESILYHFATSGGSFPEGGVIMDTAGNLYGTTFGGGPSSPRRGVVFKLTPNGEESVLYGFTGGQDGDEPTAGVILDTDGNLYGTTPRGGTSDAGVVFKVSPTGKETVLYSFTGGADGGFPFAGLVMDESGNLYGTAEGGGASGDGVVFEIKNSAQPAHP